MKRLLKTALASLTALALCLADPAWALAPTSVFNGVAGGTASPQTVTASGSCSAGQVAVASVQLTSGASGTISIQDSTDNSAASWTTSTKQLTTNSKLIVAKRVLSSSFVASTTTFTVTFGGSVTLGPGIIVSCLTDGTGVTNTTGDGGATDFSTLVTSFTQSATGPVSGISYQWAAVSLDNNINTIALGGSTTGGWTLDQKSSGTGRGLATYYRAAGGSTASTTVNATFSSTTWMMLWQEVMTTAAAPATVACPNQTLLGVC